jgi:hypothetical protein
MIIERKCFARSSCLLRDLQFWRRWKHCETVVLMLTNVSEELLPPSSRRKKQYPHNHWVLPTLPDTALQPTSQSHVKRLYCRPQLRDSHCLHGIILIHGRCFQTACCSYSVSRKSAINVYNSCSRNIKRTDRCSSLRYGKGTQFLHINTSLSSN